MNHCPKTAFSYKTEVFVVFDRKLNLFNHISKMKIKKWVDFASWNLLKEDDKVYEEEILEIKAKYGDEVSEDQIEGKVDFTVFGHFQPKMSVSGHFWNFDSSCPFFGG